MPMKCSQMNWLQSFLYTSEMKLISIELFGITSDFAHGSAPYWFISKVINSSWSIPRGHVLLQHEQVEFHSVRNVKYSDSSMKSII